MKSLDRLDGIFYQEGVRAEVRNEGLCRLANMKNTLRCGQVPSEEEVALLVELAYRASPQRAAAA